MNRSADDVALNPQAENMASEAMVRTLAAQAEAIWPQEKPLLLRYGLKPGARILDAGCGTGEISSRLADLFSTAEVVGVDILPGPLAVARARHGHLSPRLHFEQGSVFELRASDDSFDLTVCRHLLQAVPQAPRVVAELVRVTRPGGVVHLVAEDYGMLHFPVGRLDPSRFFPSAPRQFGDATGTDMFVGRHVVPVMQELGLTNVTADYVVVDTLRVPRATFAAILESWRDGYVDAIAKHTRFTREEALDYFGQIVESIRDPKRYAAWMVPIVAGRVP